MPIRRTTPMLDGIVIATAAAIAYLVLGQESLYYTDGHVLLERLRDGSLASSRHSLALPIFTIWMWVTGLDAHVAVTSACAIGSAIGVWATHSIARRLDLDRGRAALAALLLATAKPVVFFATVVEYHGLFLGVAALVFRCAAGWVGLHRPRAAVAVGLAAGIAAHVHLSGIALAAGALLWAYGVDPRAGLRRTVGAIAIALAAQLGCLVAIAAGVRALGWFIPEAWNWPATSIVVDFALHQLLGVPLQIWKEWLVPFLPLSLVPIVLLAASAHRREAVAGLLLVLIWAVLCALNVLLAPEYGAYLTPLAIPAAMLAARALPAVACAAIAVAGLGLAVAHVEQHDTRGAGYESWTTGVLAVAEDPCVIVLRGFGPHALEQLPDGAVDEIAACLVLAPRIQYVDLAGLCRADPSIVDRGLHLLAPFVTSRAGGATLLVSRATVEQLDDTERFPAGPAAVEALRAGFTFRPTASGGFDGFALEAR